jgi:hypothetical protein
MPDSVGKLPLDPASSTVMFTSDAKNAGSLVAILRGNSDSRVGFARPDLLFGAGTEFLSSGFQVLLGLQ